MNKNNNVGDDILTIVLTSYNYSRYIGQALQSVVNQSSHKWKLIIYDNCSTDCSLDVIKPYLADKRIRLVRRERNIGARNNLMLALSQGCTRFTSALQADDYLESTFVETALMCFKQHSDAPFVFFDWQQYIELTNKTVWHNSYPFSAQGTCKRFIGPFLSILNFVPMHMIVFNTDCLLRSLDELVKAPLSQLGEQFILKIIEDDCGPGVFSGRIGGVWRRHEHQITQTHIHSHIASIEETIERQWYISHASNHRANNYFMSLVAMVMISSRVEYFVSVSWVINHGKSYFNIEDKDHSCWEHHYYSIAFVVALQFATFSCVTLLSDVSFDEFMKVIGIPRSRESFNNFLETVSLREGDLFLTKDEMANIVNKFYPCHPNAASILRSIYRESANQEAQLLPNDFDSVEYLKINPDVMMSGMDPAVHYVNYGAREGRCYKKKNRDQ